MTKKDKKKIVEKLTEEFLKHLAVEAEVKISQTSVKDETDDFFQVQIETKEPGVLIGHHGETLAAFQLILGMMVYRQTNEWIRILVNVGDYRERRQESLEKMALSAAQKVKFSGEAQGLPFMNASERRIVHLTLADDPEIETESEGEGYRRRVIVKPKLAS